MKLESGDVIGLTPPISEPAETFGRRMVTGSILTVAARVAAIPLGVVATVFMARELGPGSLGVLAVTTSIVWWARQTISALFNRATIKLVAEASDWEPTALALIQLQSLAGVLAGVILFIVAPALATALDAPSLTDGMRLLALALPILALSQAHENTLIARRRFGRSALFPLFYNLSRSLALLLFVGMGWGVMGAILAELVASLVELGYARFSYRPSLFRRVAFPLRRIMQYSAPMFLDNVGRQLNPRIDLWSVQVFAGLTASGFYNVAQSALTPFRSISMMLSPLLLATLTQAWQQDHRETARTIVRHSLRLGFCTLPFIALVSGAAPGLVELVFGPEFLPAAPLVTWLSLGAFANFVLVFTMIILAAVDRPGAIAAFTLPMLLASAIGSVLLVPRIGPVGAAMTTMLTQWAAMAASLLFLRRRVNVGLESTLVIRVITISIAAYVLAALWQVTGLWVILQLAMLSLVVLLLLIAARLVTWNDVVFLRSLMSRSPDPKSVPIVADPVGLSS